MSLFTQDYDFHLPPERIAKHPLAHRADSRMLVLHRAEHRWEHRVFRDLPAFLQEGDLLVLNNTKVIPARAFSDDGRVELLFLEALSSEGSSPLLSLQKNQDSQTWLCMVKPGRRMRFGATIHVGGVEGVVTGIRASGEREIRFASPPDLEKVGRLPLPPYFERANEPADEERYQTVYASTPGAVAAPTAGLHFTPELLAQFPHAFVTLHVGAGTFKPVQSENLADHVMHRERYFLSPETAAKVAATRRVLAVGTTSLRVLEACAQKAGPGQPITMATGEGSTDIFIYPGYRFQYVNALLTNFHLPRSTLLMLVAAFAGREWVLEAYQEAIREGYRFYSYGDCMLIL